MPFLFCVLFLLHSVSGTIFHSSEPASYLGSAVSISNSGHVLATGAPNFAKGRGRVQVFERSGDGWSQRGMDLIGSNANMRTGSSLAISSNGNILAVGSPYSDHQRGQVDVYIWKTGMWQQMGQPLEGLATADMFGCSVSISNDGLILAVGARLNDGAGENAGLVQVFEWEEGAWIERGDAIDGEFEFDGFGFATSLAGNGSVLAIGAPAYMDYKGQVRTFQWDNETNHWVERGAAIVGPREFSFLGWSIDLSVDGNVLAVASPYENVDNMENAGKARVFRWSSNAWEQLGNDINGLQSKGVMGNSLTLSSDGAVVAIGSSQGRGTTGLKAGHVQVFSMIDDQWEQLEGVNLEGRSQGDRFGHSISISATNTLAIGARHSYGNAGHVETYDINMK